MQARDRTCTGGAVGLDVPKEQDVSEDPPLREIVQLACRAPSVHNTQPWRWRVRGPDIDLFADYRRQLVYADPARRDLMVSCGAALHHLQVVVVALGWSARVRRMPDPADERHVARVHLVRSRGLPADAAVLKAVAARRTDRRRPTSWPVPEERLNSLAAIGTSWGAQVLPVTGELSKAKLQRLTRRAATIQGSNPRYIDELDAWTHASQGAGVPREHVPERGAPGSGVGSDSPYARFPAGTLADPVLEVEPAEDAMLVVCTSSDDAISRVRAGEAMSALWLHATQENLSILPLSQAVEVEETRRDLHNEVLGGLAFPQILLRVGWLPLVRDELPPTPRRPLDEVMTS
jgi:nitroreductase